MSADTTTAKKWQEPPCYPEPHSLGDTSPRTASMRGACPQDAQDSVNGVTCPLGPHLRGAMSRVAPRTPTMSCHIHHNPIHGVTRPLGP